MESGQGLEKTPTANRKALRSQSRAAAVAAMKGRCHDSEEEEEEAEADPRLKRGSSSRRSISMGDFQRAVGQGRSEPPSAASHRPRPPGW
ncbi:hypothetical protein SKAU_G00089450 [Synaphobranchus kaupii]|uniref:Uncharacterized protein n=1 Tax=Synaphobranchus kaupii TaxID=118154 RepID=A0A9Q1FWV1_SYNKA|nr:hypothetical protein SKAU_G00089450 [Synaphobranchus kaupii]